MGPTSGRHLIASGGQCCYELELPERPWLRVDPDDRLVDDLLETNRNHML